jgi:hypothetical protein
VIHILLPENRGDGPVRRDRLPPLTRPSLLTIHDLPNRAEVEVYGDHYKSFGYTVWKWHRKTGA